jgi:hypothetical protein
MLQLGALHFSLNWVHVAKYKINGMVYLNRKEKSSQIYNMYFARNSYTSRLPQHYQAVHRIIKRK